MDSAWIQNKQNCAWCGKELGSDKVSSELNVTKQFNPTRKDWVFHKECVGPYEERENGTVPSGPVVTDAPVATHKITISPMEYFFGGGLK